MKDKMELEAVQPAENSKVKEETCEAGGLAENKSSTVEKNLRETDGKEPAPADTRREGSTSENLKIELHGLPHAYSMKKLKKLLNETLKLNALRMKPGGAENKWAKITFQDDEARQKALAALQGYKLKKCSIEVSLLHQGSVLTATGSEQSFRDSSIQTVRRSPSQGCPEVAATGITRKGINLRTDMRVGTWNILSLRDHQLPHLSDELSRLNVKIVGLSETRRPGSGQISSGGYTYYWSGMKNGTHLKGVAIAISNHLQPFIVEITPLDEHIMQMRVKHTIGFISLIAVYAPSDECETQEKETFYTKLNFVLDQCPPRDIVIVLGNFDATTGTERAGFEFCLGPHGSGTRNSNSSLFLNFAKSRGLRIAGSWHQRPEVHQWTWYSSDGEATKEINHILVNTRWRIIKNCRVFRSAEFFETDHRLVVATLKIHLKTTKS